MIRINIDILLKKMHKTRYWLAKEMGSSFQAVNRLYSNNVVSIHLDTILKLCKILECEPNDLFTVKHDDE